MAAEPTGNPRQIAALLATEARLGVRFSDAYRDFVANRKRYTITVKRISLFPVSRCDWLGEQQAIAIGRSFTDGPGTLCFKVARKIASDVVHVWEAGKLTRIPAFAELVEREREPVALAGDARVRLAERLGGAARRCACGQEIRILQVCACGRIGARTDAPYVLSAREEADAERAFPTLVRAARLVAALKAAGHVVPSGATQLLVTADLLAAAAPAPALIAAWKTTGMAVAVDAPTVARLMAAR